MRHHFKSFWRRVRSSSGMAVLSTYTSKWLHDTFVHIFDVKSPLLHLRMKSRRVLLFGGFGLFVLCNYVRGGWSSSLCRILCSSVWSVWNIFTCLWIGTTRICCLKHPNSFTDDWVGTEGWKQWREGKASFCHQMRFRWADAVLAPPSLSGNSLEEESTLF